MIRRIAFLSAAAIACGLCSCDKMTSCESGTSRVMVNVSAKDETKALGVTADSECAYQSVQILVFDSDGALDTDGYAAVDVDGNFSIELDVYKGKGKSFYAVTNLDRITSVSTEADFLSRVSQLSDNSIGSLVMKGVTVTDIDGDCSVTINVRRLTAKVELEKISVAFEDCDYPSLTVNAVYLTNVNSKVSLGGEAPAAAGDWLNQRGYSPSSCNAILYESYSRTIADGSSDSAAHTFYCYPNPVVADTHDEVNAFTVRCTRLVIDTDLGYYHVDLCDSEKMPDGLESNCCYLIRDIVITGEGAGTPEEHTSRANVTCTVEIIPWQDAASYIEEI